MSPENMVNFSRFTTSTGDLICDAGCVLQDLDDALAESGFQVCTTQRILQKDRILYEVDKRYLLICLRVTCAVLEAIYPRTQAEYVKCVLETSTEASWASKL